MKTWYIKDVSTKSGRRYSEAYYFAGFSSNGFLRFESHRKLACHFEDKREAKHALAMIEACEASRGDDMDDLAQYSIFVDKGEK